MIDWTKSMQQTYEYYVVDPATWKDVRLLDNVKSCTITRDTESKTLGSATFSVAESVGECYIRVYLIAIQNGVKEKVPLGTFLAQTPTSIYNGKVREVTMDGYTPLLELKEKNPPIGYTVRKNEDIFKTAFQLCQDKKLLRAPVIEPDRETKLTYDFVADVEDTWLTYLTALISNGTYISEGFRVRTGYTFDLDAMGRVTFAPKQDIVRLQPVWTYNDDNSSILTSELTLDHDIFGIPNVVEVIYSDDKNNIVVTARNDDKNSPTSTVNRGREIHHRITDPEVAGLSPTDGVFFTEEQLQEYAEQVLSELSTVEYTISYTHGYCPVRLGDCVRINYSKAGLTNIRAKVINQSIKCTPGCQVTEKAVFTAKLWR